MAAGVGFTLQSSSVKVDSELPPAHIDLLVRVFVATPRLHATSFDVALVCFAAEVTQ